ncbi:MAG: hypothetical protein NW223_23345 [Hyphomicrobiaceae bacterium]|nr:hypothetical protein [Hyphomicrobiaceae bacterium]
MLGEEIETLRDQMRQAALQEEAMLRSLAESINAVEEMLLQRVRDIAAEHGARRSQLLDELRGLAGRIGTLPAVTESSRLEGGVVPVMFSLASSEAAVARSGADWRHAARAIADDEELADMLQTGTG